MENNIFKTEFCSQDNTIFEPIVDIQLKDIKKEDIEISTQYNEEENDLEKCGYEIENDIKSETNEVYEDISSDIKIEEHDYKTEFIKEENKMMIPEFLFVNMSDIAPNSLQESYINEDETRINSEETFFCDICHKKFDDKLIYKKHYSTHLFQNLFQCPICKMEFNRLYNMKLHMRTHTGQKTSNKKFSLSKELTAHKEIHAGEKSFACDILDKKYITTDISKHKRVPTGKNSTNLNSSKGKIFEPTVKRVRKVMTLEQKIQILDKLESGETSAAVGRYFHMNESSVRTIKRSETAIRSSVKAITPKSAKITYKSRDPCLERAEKALSLWIEDMSQRKITLSSNMIRDKMRKLYYYILETTSINTNNIPSPNSSFQASKSWFENFRKRSHLPNVKTVGDAVQPDHVAAENFTEELKKLIKNKGYFPEQVFNADETVLFWKRMPARTFISKNEQVASGFKAAKDRLTLLLCANASGDCLVKPMLVYRALNPRALKGINKNKLPVYWKSNPMAWVTGRFFMDWFHNCFVNDVERYLLQKNLAFRVLLILDNAPGHPVNDLINGHPNIEVTFLPPNTTTIQQPFDQGVMKCFKSYYTRRNFTNITNSIKNDPTLTITNCWKRYTIIDCINNINECLSELTPSTINSCWSKLWPDVVSNFKGFPTIEAELRKIVALGHNLGGEGFIDLEEADVEDLLNVHSEELTEEDLEALIKMNEGENEEQNGQIKKPAFNLQVLNEAMQMARNAAELLVENDPLMERSLKFKRGLEGLLLPYKEILKDLQR